MAENDRKIEQVKIHYNKNPLYREIYTDGAIGGFSPAGTINICFYATRRVIPKSISYEVGQNGILGNETKTSEDSKEGIMREIEFGIYLNRKTAQDLHDFLGKMLEKKK